MNLHRLSFRLLAGTCVLCGAGCTSSDNLHRDLCEPCWRDLPWNTQACEHCGLPLTTGGYTCENCLQQPPAFTLTISPLRYRFPVDILVLGFKESGRQAAGAVLGQLLADAVIPLVRTLDLQPQLVPVPLHVSRRLARGFNQSRILADIVAELSGLRVNDVLVRTRRGLDQKQLTAIERRRHLNGMFRARRSVKGTILLIDDVVTTGATADACAKALLAAGAEDVILAAPARTGVV